MQTGLDGQILAPRIFGHAVGLHPIISVFSLLVGMALFGLLGALFACPAAGIIQTFLCAGFLAYLARAAPRAVSNGRGAGAVAGRSGRPCQPAVST